MTDDYEHKQDQQAADMDAYAQYAVEEARGYEQIFWEQVFLAAYNDLSVNAQQVSWKRQAEIAAEAADAACAERAKRLK